MENIRWKPSEGETYYSINTCGNIVKNMWYDLEFDNGCYEMNNCFKTEDDAILAKNNYITSINKNELIDYNKVVLITKTSDGVIIKVNCNEDIIYKEDSSGTEEYTYDNKGRLIHSKESNGFEVWHEYDETDKYISFKSSTGYEENYIYDDNNNLIRTESNGELIEENKYNSRGNIIYSRYKDDNSDKFIEYWYDYDEDGYLFHMRKSTGYEEFYEYTD